MSDWYFLRNGGQLGPVSWEELLRHGQTGGLRPSDLVWTAGMPEWRPASLIPGIVSAGSYGQPSLQAMPYAYAYPVGGYPIARSLGDDRGTRWLLPVGRSPWAIAAGYFGLLSWLVIFAPLALASGIVAVVDIKRNPHKHGMGRAVFGIVMGALGSILIGAFLVGV